jgi:hypothetical protein
VNPEDKITRLAAERANCLQNARGWRAQLERHGPGNYPPDDLLSDIEKAELEAARLAGEIIRLLDSDRQERQRQMRSRYADQVRELGERLPETKES